MQTESLKKGRGNSVPLTCVIG